MSPLASNLAIPRAVVERDTLLWRGALDVTWNVSSSISLFLFWALVGVVERLVETTSGESGVLVVELSRRQGP